MKTIKKCLSVVMGALFVMALFVSTTLAATNEATDPGGGGVSMLPSGTVTVNSTQLQLVKQVWADGACITSSPAFGGCASAVVTVPAGKLLTFLILVDNSTGAEATNVRIQDLLNEGASDFTFVENTYGAGTSLAWNNNTTNTGAALATIIADSDDLALTDVVGAPDDIASATDTGASPAGKDRITIGTVTGQVNTQLNIPAGKIFAFQFRATKK